MSYETSSDVLYETITESIKNLYHKETWDMFHIYRYRGAFEMSDRIGNGLFFNLLNIAGIISKLSEAGICSGSQVSFHQRFIWHEKYEQWCRKDFTLLPARQKILVCSAPFRMLNGIPGLHNILYCQRKKSKTNTMILWIIDNNISQDFSIGTAPSVSASQPRNIWVEK